MQRFISAVLIVLLGACTLGQPARAQAPAAQDVIRELEVRGYDHVSPEVQAKLLPTLKSQVGQVYSDAVAKEDVNTLLESGWFYRVLHRKEAVADGVKVIFTVMENPLVQKIEFEGNTKMTTEELQAVIKTRTGEVLNPNQVSQDALEVRKAYAAKGYTLVNVAELNISRDGQLKFSIFEPKIGEIRVEADKKNLRTREYVIRRELRFKVGDIYNERDVRDSLRALERLSIFQEVQAIPEPGTEPGSLSINIRITERRTGMAAVGLGHNNIKGLIGFLEVADTNLFGTGQKLNLRLQYGADDSYTLSYTNPWLGPKRTALTLNVYDRTILRQAVQVDETYVYNEDRRGGNATLSRPLSRDQATRASLSLRVDSVKASEEDEPVPAELLESSDVRSLTLAAVRDTRDSLLNPTEGRYASVGVELAGLLGGADFTKITAEGRRYWILRRGKDKPVKDSTGNVISTQKGQPIVLASRVMAGSIAGDPPFLDQFLMGGSNTLRGYGEDRFPGQHQVLLNNEVRVPINESLQGVAFLDAGGAWGGRFADSFGDTSFKLHTGYGVGVRLQTPIGPLRLDYGLSGNGGHEFHFGIGSTY